MVANQNTVTNMKGRNDTMKHLTRLLALALCLALCLSLAACGSSGSSTTADAPAADAAPAADTSAADAPADGDYKVFNYGTTANSTTFDPASDLQSDSGNFLVHAVGETLWTCTADGEMTMKLAEAVDYTPEHLDITLKQGVKFSNGDELTVDDVLATLLNMTTAFRTMSMVACLDLANAEIVDDYHVIIPLNNYDAALIDLLGNASSMILDADVIGADGYSFDWLIGTGPYMLKGDGVSDKSGWEESVKYTLVRNPGYWGEAPYYDEIDVYFYSEENTRYADLQVGNLDAAFLTQATYINNLASGNVPDASLVSVQENAVYFIEMAQVLGEASGEPGEAGPFADINVRRAFAHCLDIPTIVEALGEGVYDTASCVVGSGSWIYEDLGAYEYDPELAAQYLAEAGYSVDNPLNVKVSAEATDWIKNVFEAAQPYAAAIGINLDLSGIADFATILPNLIAGQVEVSYGPASSGSGNDPGNLLQQLGPESDNALLKIRDEHLAELFVQGSQETDHAKRAAIYQELVEGLYDNYQVIPVCVGTKSYGVNNAHTSFAAAIDASNQPDPTLFTD